MVKMVHLSSCKKEYALLDDVDCNHTLIIPLYCDELCLFRELTDDDKNQCIGTGIIKILVGEVGAMTIAVGKDGVDLTLLQFLKEFERGLAGAPSDDMREDFCERAEISVQESLIKQLTIADCLEPHVFVEGLEATDERDTFYLCCGS
eukprot:m.565335 g.565335  ORF g.565335 m.565335 type:complete len:148 (+) comp22242_c0_seq7:372-815(+)